MSHTTTLKTVLIRDVDALRAAVEEMKASGVDCALVENATPRMYFSNQHGKCDYVLRLNNSRYDVGFDKQADGSYAPVMDTFGGQVRAQIGVETPTCPLPRDRNEAEAMLAIGRFQQAYAKHTAINAAVSQGYMVESTYLDDEGNVQLVVQVGE